MTEVPKVLSLFLVAAALMGAGRESFAEAPKAKDHDRIHVGVQAGVMLPQVGSELGTSFFLELEGGYRVWGRLAIVASVGYSQPAVAGSENDPRLAGESYETTTTQRELSISAGVLWWFRPMTSRLNPYAALAARAYLLETVTNGESAGEPFLENRETSMRWGGVLSAGAQLRLGPGAIVGEFEIGGSDLSHLITGDVATTAVVAGLGYRLSF
jgi:hypothetical protein